MKIWSLPKHENLTTGKKILWKRGEIAPKFSSFPQYFQYISNFQSTIINIFVKCGCSTCFFLNSANLICRCTDISKYFRESLGIRDNESRLYLLVSLPSTRVQLSIFNVIWASLKQDLFHRLHNLFVRSKMVSISVFFD